MKNETELTLVILDCFSKHGSSLSLTDLCSKTKVPKARVKRIVSVLEKRGYLTKTEGTSEYVLGKKFLTLD